MGFGFGYYGVEVLEHFGNAHGVEFASRVVALFDDLLQISAGDLNGQLIGDDFAGTFLLLDPGGAGHRDPHRMVIEFEAHIDCIGMAGGDGDDVRLPPAIEVFAGPSIFDVEFFVHGSRLSFRQC